MIVAALAAGASAGIGDAASQGIKDAYAGLKALIARRFTRNGSAQAMLRAHAAEPATYEKPLAKHLQETGADRDADIVRLAEALLRLVEGAGGQPGYHVEVTGGQVGNIGPGGHIDSMRAPVTYRRCDQR
jgi:hypothetical protein